MFPVIGTSDPIIAACEKTALDRAVDTLRDLVSGPHPRDGYQASRLLPNRPTGADGWTMESQAIALAK
jgi:hypothetical protein